MKVDCYDRIMAIDYGLRRIGIALSDPLKKFAYPYKTIENNKNLFTNLIKIVNDMNVSLILIGIPNDENINVNSISKNINEFKSELLSRINIEILFWDESFSSKIAQQKILESVVKKKSRKNKSLLDMHSAAIILTEYLEQHFNYSK